MSAERLFRALGLVDGDLVEEAGRAVPRQGGWQRWMAAAACLALVCALGFGWVVTGGFHGYGSAGGSSGDSGGPVDGAAGPSSPSEPVPGTAGPSSSNGGQESGIDNGTVFQSYAGPVFPLSTVEDPGALTAERDITWDFAPGTYPDGSPRQWGARVTDAYVLQNPTDSDITVTALYPFSGTFAELAALRPTAAVDGTDVDTTLYAGAYSGGFQSTFGADTPDTMNLESLDSWTEYQALLESGEYLAQALGDAPSLDTLVTLYEFKDFSAPHDRYPAATQAVTFTIDESATRVLTYGFNGSEQDGGFRRYSYFVPDGHRRESDYKLLAVLGEDIGAYTLQGYRDGGCDRGDEIDGVTCTVTRSVTTLRALLDRLCKVYAAQYAQGRAADQDNAFDAVSFPMYRRAAAELLAQYGPFSDQPMDRYSDGRLDDILSETLHHDRVLYLLFPVTVPAGESVQVSFAFWKEPSFDHACTGSGNQGLQGYDLVTRLGSSLTFTRQTAALVGTEGVEIVRGDLRDGGDLHQEHYFLELRPRDETQW